jgi:tryptophan-rich sensory protein
MNIPKLAASILITNLIGIIGSIFTSQSITTWYQTIQKPPFTPPNWLFAPAWITLYTLMGISLYLAWEKGLKKNRPALYVFSIQLILNALWSFLFFGLKNPFYGLIGISALWIAIALNIWYFYKISKKSAYLLIPYFVWVGFAFILNYYIFILN